MYKARTSNEYFDEERMEWHIETMTLWHVKGEFKIIKIEYFEVDEFNGDKQVMVFNKEELDNYLTTMYNTKTNTGFIDACYSYLASLNKEGN